MRKLIPSRTLIGGFSLVVIFVLALGAPPASSQVKAGGLKIAPPVGSLQSGEGIEAISIPANCSIWHELSPVYCTPRHQDAYADNGDGVMSPCDFITLGGIVYHIDEVGPTYYFYCIDLLPAPDDTFHVAWDIDGPHNPSNPVGEVWHTVFSDSPSLTFCNNRTIASYVNNDSDSRLSPGDRVTLVGGVGTTIYILYDIKVDITLTPAKYGEIPTLNEWGILFLTLLLAGMGVFFLRRRAVRREI